MKDYTILAKFIVPFEQVDVVLRDPMYSGIQYAGCYLLKDNREDRDEWYRDDPTKSISGLNPACKYVLAYEDYGNVFLPSDADEVDETKLDQRDGFWDYTQALLAFQSTVTELVTEMTITSVQSRLQADFEREYDAQRRQEAAEALREKFAQEASEDTYLKDYYHPDFNK